MDTANASGLFSTDGATALELPKNDNGWNPNYRWLFAENLDRSVAYIFYNYSSPTVCKGFSEQKTRVKAKPDILRQTSYEEWSGWTTEDRGVYVLGYLDTAQALEARKVENGLENSMSEITELIEAVGVSRDSRANHEALIRSRLRCAVDRSARLRGSSGRTRQIGL